MLWVVAQYFPIIECFLLIKLALSVLAVRGVLAQLHLGLRRGRYAGAVALQRLVRGTQARDRVACLNRLSVRYDGAVALQKIWRSWLGRRKALHRVELLTQLERLAVLRPLMQEAAFQAIGIEFLENSAPLTATRTVLQCSVNMCSSGDARPRGGWAMSWARLRRRVMHPQFYWQLQVCHTLQRPLRVGWDVVYCTNIVAYSISALLRLCSVSWSMRSKRCSTCQRRESPLC